MKYTQAQIKNWVARIAAVMGFTEYTLGHYSLTAYEDHELPKDGNSWTLDDLTSCIGFMEMSVDDWRDDPDSNYSEDSCKKVESVLLAIKSELGIPADQEC